MAECIFRAAGDGVFEPTAHARGPWDPDSLHGGAAAALIVGALERLDPAPDAAIARLDFEFVRPVPLAALRLSTRVAQAGRRVQRLEAQLASVADDRIVCQARALRCARVPDDLPPAGADAPAGGAVGGGDGRLPAPDDAAPVVFSLDGEARDSFASTAIEMRPVGGDLIAPGPATVWMRLRFPVVEGEPVTPLMRMAAAADFGNGVSAALPFGEWLFINADLTVRLQRQPAGEWIALDARSDLIAGGVGLATSALYDRGGLLGCAQQSLVVQRR